MAKNDKAVKPTKKVRQRANKRPLTDTFTAICLSELRMEVVKEFQFHPTRRWRFDYAIPSHKIALEVEGGVFSKGRHTRGAGFIGDIEKYNEATRLGWRVVRTVPWELNTRKTVQLLRELINNSTN